MRLNSWICYLCRLALFLFLFGDGAHAENMKRENKLMKFGYTTNGAADGSINKYGNNSISVFGDFMSVQIGDSINDRNISGVGVYKMRLRGEDMKNARELAELLCFPIKPDDGRIIPIIYGAMCEGGMRHGYISDFNLDVASKIGDLVDLLTNAGVLGGRKAVKLDISLVSIDRAGGGLSVSVRFSNSGDYPIKFKTPDKWDAGMGKDSLGVSDTKTGMGVKFGLDLVGQTLLEPMQFPDGDIHVAPHSDVVVKMKTNNIDKFSAGTYDLYAGAFMNINVVGIESSLLRVDFHSDYTKPTRITFDRDYPSTPQEREQWEAYQRTRLSYFPMKPGQTFKEDGLYRAVRTDSTAHRSLQLVPFKAGDVATTERVKMLMEGGDGISLDGPVEWLWEGSAPTPVKEYSFDTIEETRQFSPSGVPCPRSGRWLPRVREGWNSTRYDPMGIVTLRYGQTMPALKATGDDADWEWIGA
ncbi:hypothetical protein [Burkholderia cenocepacia]|uniref:hypothetical protein n=1 Tax=Burkholderia cenocepacia TaxID=95486 RepID=UPI00158DA1C2|nr:hypothetical protein [Burkholderia cenocepacia]